MRLVSHDLFVFPFRFRSFFPFSLFPFSRDSEITLTDLHCIRDFIKRPNLSKENWYIFYRDPPGVADHNKWLAISSPLLMQRRIRYIRRYPVCLVFQPARDYPRLWGAQHLLKSLRNLWFSFVMELGVVVRQVLGLIFASSPKEWELIKIPTNSTI